MYRKYDGSSFEDGYYVTADNSAHRNISVMEDGVIKSSISAGSDYFKKVSGNKYEGFKCVRADGTLYKPNYRFFLEIISDTKILLYREGKQKYTLSLKTTESIMKEMDDCTVYQKYMDKVGEDPVNAQVWTMCATAALQLCNAPDDETRKQVYEMYVTILKGLSSDKCPCSDVIPDKYWE